MSRPRLLSALLTCIFIAAGLLYYNSGTAETVRQSTVVAAADSAPPAPPEPVADEYGLIADSLDVVDGTIERNATLADLFAEHGLPYSEVLRVVDAAGSSFDVRGIRAGKQYRLYRAQDSTQALRYLVYERNPIDFVVFDMADSARVYHDQREVEIVQRTVAGKIDGSLFETVQETGAPMSLAMELANVYAWQIDFYRIQKGDNFSVIFEEKQVDGETVGVGRVLAARFTHHERYANAPHDFYAFYFDEGKHAGHYDEDGGSLRKALLKAPLKYSRISSRYTKNRFHPILKRNRAHLGTDYAAPQGTPVYSVGEGVVTRAGYSRGNGNYVKVRHNETYSTQYLHFNRIAEGIEPGVHVKQGEVIGYVGQTGLATGPHLCYRFWKNGKQVDPYKQKIPPAHPVADSLREPFEQVVDRYLERLAPAATDERPQLAQEAGASLSDRS